MSIFSKIISGEIPAHKVAETSDFLAFYKKNRMTKNTVLIELLSSSLIFIKINFET